MKFLDRLRPVHCYALIAGAVLLVFGRVVWHEFVDLDDMLLITGNSAVQRISGATLFRIFTMYDPELYIPFTFLIYQIEYALVGSSPWLYHLTNVLLHLLSALLVFRIAGKLSGQQVVGLLCALLWALHPLQAEAVAWAAARKDTLSAVFFFAAVWQHLRCLETNERRHTWWSLGFFAVGLLAKVTVLMLPFVLLLIDWQQGRRDWKKMILEKVPYLVLSIVFGIIAVAGKEQNISDLTFFAQVLLWCKSVVHALRQFVVPFDLRVFYQQWTPITLGSVEFLLPLILTLSLIPLVWFFRKQKDIALGTLFALLMYAPVFATFTKIHRHFYASDRYTYLALFGAAYLLAIGLSWLMRRSRFGEILAALMLVIFAGVSFRQTGTWRTSETLFAQTLHYEPSGIAEQNLGAFYVRSDRRAEGIAAFERSIQADPLNDGALVNLGRLAVEDGQSEVALAHFQAAVAAVETRPVLYPTDLLPYYELSEWHDARGRTEEMFTALRRAAERGPEQPDAHFNLGLKLQKYGRLEEAYASFTKAAALNTAYVAAQYHLAAVAAELGKIDEAITLLERVERLQPGYEKTAYHLQNLRRLQPRE